MAPAGPGEKPPLKAIIFADACGGPPSPSTAAAAAQSLPLHGSPLLHYQLYALATTGVAEALVLSSAPVALPTAVHAMAVTALSNPTWRSHGDALRDVESRQALRPAHDFLLVQPGALFNIHAAGFARAHAARAAADRNWLVSLVFRRAAAAAPLAVATHASSGALCLYKPGRDAAAAAVLLDTRAENVGLRGGGAVRVTNDVVDVGLDVCSPDLLVEFRENFDFDHVRDYVRAKLDGGEAELLGNRMHAHFVDSAAGEFAACVDGFAGYRAASRDVTDGWLRPIAPARVARVGGGAARQLGGGVVCFGDADGLDATAHVVDGAVGDGAVVEAGASVRACVLGKNVFIGAGALVEDCILCDDVRVGSAAAVKDCLLLQGCQVAREVVIPANCFLDRGVVVGRGGGAEGGMKANSWVAKRRDAAGGGAESEEDGSDDGTAHAVAGPVGDADCLGDGGAGDVLPDRRRADLYLEHTVPDRDGGGAGWPSFLSRVESDSEDELEGDGHDALDDSDDCVHGVGNGGDGTAGAKLSAFYAEMVETVEHGVSKGVDVDTIALEVNSLKLAYELMYSDARIGVVRALVAIVRKQNTGAAPNALWRAVKSMFGRWIELVGKFSSGDNAATQRALVDELARFLVGDGTMLKYVLRALYDGDVVDEDVIIGWAADERRAVAAGSDGQLLQGVLPFVEWLEEADEEDDSDGEEE
jgi:translation initiation factor eIF-2B subunit epsilon